MNENTSEYEKFLTRRHFIAALAASVVAAGAKLPVGLGSRDVEIIIGETDTLLSNESLRVFEYVVTFVENAPQGEWVVGKLLREYGAASSKD